MKIAFITTCLEPGKDGVGDYTTMLAEECARLGHEVRRVALNDPYATDTAGERDILRLRASRSWKERIDAVRAYLREFDPDFVSLQFVCYGFHPRGIDFALARRLHAIIGLRKVQIMFHELWIGAAGNAPWKERLTGVLQRFCVLGVVNALSPCVVHTSNAAYVELLRRNGIKACVLPLFGAVPPSIKETTRRGTGELIFAIFGTLHPVWPPEPLFSRLLATGRPIKIVHVGRLGAGHLLWQKMKVDYAGRVVFEDLGEQPVEKIAEFFQDADFGISTTPWELTGKSATVAAMLEHGLPVVVNRDDWHLAHTTSSSPVSPLLMKMDEFLPEKLSAASRGKPHSRLAEVTGKFLAALERVA